MPARPKSARQVRCLGPGVEHTFWTVTPTTNRICERCKRKLRETRYSPIVEYPLPDPPPPRNRPRD